MIQAKLKKSMEVVEEHSNKCIIYIYIIDIDNVIFNGKVTNYAFIYFATLPTNQMQS